MHIAILMANTDETDFAQVHPKDGEKWQAFLTPYCEDCTFTVFAVKDGIFPTNITAYDGFLITGSPASVHDNAPWLEALFALIRDINTRKIPLYGACFGHQAIAVALGGVVTENPNGWVFGTTETHVVDTISGLDIGPLTQYAAHIEQVSTLPKTAQIVLQNNECPIGGFAIGNHVLTNQYHPEMTSEFIAALIEELAPVKPDDVIKRARSSLTTKATNAPVARAILRFFSHQTS